MKVASTYKGIESTAASKSPGEEAAGMPLREHIYQNIVAPDDDVCELCFFRLVHRFIPTNTAFTSPP